MAAARLVADTLLSTLEERLPPGEPPPTSSPTFLPWREDIQLALVETLAELNKLFALKGILAGCTATLVLQVHPPAGLPCQLACSCAAPCCRPAPPCARPLHASGARVQGLCLCWLVAPVSGVRRVLLVNVQLGAATLGCGL